LSAKEDLDQLENAIMVSIHQIFVDFQGKPETATGHSRPEAWSDKVWSWDPALIVWVKTEGSKGPYERADGKQNSQSIDFANMLKDLTEHQGSITRNGLYYWKFDNSDIAGRKQAKKQ
jgi:hypothetical protein